MNSDKYKLRFRFSDEDKARAANDIKLWGYPAHDLYEYGRGESGDRCIVLIEFGDEAAWGWLEWLDDESFSGHLCIKPDNRGKVLCKEKLNEVFVLCTALGANYLYLFDMSTKKILRSSETDFSLEIFAMKHGFSKSTIYQNAWVREL